MFLNYLAGAVSMLLAVSAFIPWVKVWFFTIKGIDSFNGIVVLIVGLMGIAVAIFQHLSGKIRGRAFIGFSIAALLCEALYIRNMAEIGSRINKGITLLTELFGEKLMLTIQQLIGEDWVKRLTGVMKIAGIDTSVSGFDFIGSGLVLACGSSLALLVIGIMVEKQKSTAE